MIDSLLLNRFKRHVVFLDDSDDSCWLWTGAMRDEWRGRIKVERKSRSAHRVAWELLHGRRIPEGKRLVRMCSNPLCVRHWKVDKLVRKLSDEDVAKIRASNLSLRATATLHGVSQQHVWEIKRNERRCP